MDSLPINTVDLAVAGVLIISGLIAFMRGLVHEVLSVSAWIGAGFATLYGYPYLTPYVMEFIASELIAQVIAGVGVFVAVLIVISLISHGLSRRVRESALGALDRSLGFIFGLFRGAFLVCLTWLVFAWMVQPDERPEWVIKAKVIPVVQLGAELLVDLVPQGAKESGADAITGAQDKAQETLRDQVRKEVDRQMDEVMAPRSEPQGEQPSSGDQGYSQDQRDSLNGLIKNQQ